MVEREGEPTQLSGREPSRVGRVVACLEEPNPLVKGKGLERLRSAGIRVETGLLAAQAREAHLGFLSRMERGRPWLRLKCAASLDGRVALANGESRWITGEPARRDGRVRSMIGIAG